MRSGAAIDRVIVVTRPTQLEELTGRFNTVGQAKFYLKQAGQAFDPVQAAHDRYHRALDTVMGSLPSSLKQMRLERSLAPQFEFGNDVVVVLGQDGLVSNTAKYLPNQPLIGVNPDPSLFDGVLLPWRPEDAGDAIDRAMRGSGRLQHVVLAKATTSDGRSLLAFNDLFIGARTHFSARYEIALGDRRELQSSSGIIVSTGAGSTGWMKSILRGATAISGSEPGKGGNWDREAEMLRFAVREPFPSRITGTTIVTGDVTPGAPLLVRSQMARDGVVFSDGMEMDFIEFNSGADLTVSIAPQRAHLLVK